LSQVTRWLDDLSFRESERHKWLQRLEEAVAYENYIELRQQYEKLVRELQLKERKVKEEVENFQTEMTRISEQLENCRITYNSLQIVKEKGQFWRDQLNEYNRLKQDVEAYPVKRDRCERLIYLLNLQSKYLVALQEKQTVLVYNEWTKSYETLAASVESAREELSKIKSKIVDIKLYLEHVKVEREYKQHKDWLDWSNRVNGLTLALYIRKKQQVIKDLEIFAKIQELKKEKEYWSEVIKIKPLWLEKTQISEDLKYFRRISEQLAITNVKLTHIQEENQKNKNLKDTYFAIMQDLANRKKGLELLEQLFGGYKNWVYKTVIIPKIVNLTNCLAGHLLKDGQELNCEFLDDAVTEKRVLHWIIKHDVKCSSIQRAGGYFAFVFGLLIRVAIASLGAASLTSNQIFIDEGFVSGSSKSIEEVPSFISHLKSIYEAVFLVTHTDIIKETATISCELKKNKITSLTQLQFGCKKKFELYKPTDAEEKKRKLATESNISKGVPQVNSRTSILNPQNLEPQVNSRTVKIMLTRPPDLKLLSEKNSPVITNMQQRLISKEDPAYVLGKCRVLTLKGLQCKRNASSGMDFCTTHQKMAD
jgi:DNA repair exonuclease SbcCD ATPase subunit